MKTPTSPHVNKRRKTIEFYIHNDCASQICLAGSFNHWAQDEMPLQRTEKGVWKIAIPLLPAGKYHYKFFIDDRMAMEDVDNPHREPDGKVGFNSVLILNEKGEAVGTEM
jgi:1,4-alpha-glucan branching enzyme